MPAFAPRTLNKTVTTAATRIQISTTTLGSRLIIIQANTGNVGNIFIGSSNVSSSVFGIKLAAGQSIAFENDGNDARFDLSEFYADTDNSGDGFSVLYF